MKLTIDFADQDDFRNFLKWMEKAKTPEAGTPAPLWNALAASAVKRATIKTHKPKGANETNP